MSVNKREENSLKGGPPQQAASRRRRVFCSRAVCLFIIVLACAVAGFAQRTDFENRPISDVVIAFEGTDRDAVTSEQFHRDAVDALGTTYSAVRIRDAIDRLYRTREIANISVQASEAANNAVSLRFVIKRKTQAKRVTIRIVPEKSKDVTEAELLSKLNLLDPGAAVTDQALRNNADLILEYLRDRGFFKAEVTFSQQPLQNDNEAAVTFVVTPNAQATVDKFVTNVEGFDSALLQEKIKLTPGEPFTREALAADVERIKDVLRKNDYLVPELNEPRVVYERETNKISIELTGKKGPIVKVTVEAGKDKIGSGTQDKLLPLKREGTLDYAAIIEGERKLENYYQERGYFFVDVVPVCAVEPPFAEGDATSIKNETEFLCSALNSADLTTKTVNVIYRVNLNRKLRLTEIRLKGTDQFTIADIQSVLVSQEANILGFVPLFGYGNGYTSEKLLRDDAATIRSLLRELGYRDATVRVNQGVTPDGADLIITFVVEQGPATVISDVEITGNTAFTDAQLKAQITDLTGKNYSRARVRNQQRKLSAYYSQAGFYDAVVDFSTDEGPADPVTGTKSFKVSFNVRNEGTPVYIDRVLVTGTVKTKPEAVLRALTLQPNDLLKAGDVYTSEQNLYSSDAFQKVEITPRPAGTRPDGSAVRDVIVNVEEQPSRILSYGGGFSTDLGASGFVDIRHFNLFGRLWQGGARIKVSQRQQLALVDYVNPRFIRDGDKRFAPLTISAQYQRDSTVTRFFRSAFDKGTFGIVQRIDASGNPIDEFGAKTGSPTLNRLTLTAETNRTVSRRDRSILFFRYRFEDVRIYNVQSLLIKDLLVPDSRIRISGFGATFVRDTRKRCGIQYTILEIIARGEPGEPCKYNASDPTNGDYFTAEYNVSVPVLGANIGFHKFQASYNYYYTFPGLKNTTIAARGILGLASVFSKGNRFSAEFPDLEGILPISERFFAGGANTLRGFDFESAGPRVVVVPQGIFRDSSRNPKFLDPFTVPFGGNALAVVNIEARVPLTKSVRAVPFYDGGNVFRRVSDIFNPPSVPANDVFRQNLRALWSHTVGLGLRLKTPIGGEFGIDYGYLLNPPQFLIPQPSGPNAIYRLHQSQIHFRFSQAF
ncbi:MAG: POTRA domain-containing protein [Pyrinomonadaceae bacterium]